MPGSVKRLYLNPDDYCALRDALGWEDHPDMVSRVKAVLGEEITRELMLRAQCGGTEVVLESGSNRPPVLEAR